MEFAQSSVALEHNMYHKFGSGTNVIEILLRATNQNPEILKPAERELQALETAPGFYSLLKDVYLERSLHSDIRLLALIYFKNGTEKYWRPTAPNAIPNEEKRLIRAAFLASIPEPHKVIASHVAYLIGRMARFDFPKHWPELIPTLMAAAKSDDPLTQNRGLMILNQVVKVLVGKRLPYDRAIFEQVTEVIYSDLVQIWDTLCQIFTTKVQEYTNSGQNISEIMTHFEQTNVLCYLESILAVTKTLASLTVFGSKKEVTNDTANRFIEAIFVHARFMLHFRKALGRENELLEKFVVRCMKILLSCLKVHTTSFNYITQSLEFAVGFAFSDEGQHFLFEKFLIECFDLINKIILFPNVKVSRFTGRPNISRDIKDATAACIESFFTPQTVLAIFNKMVACYFILTPEELELWRNDPESFALASTSGDSPEYCLRSGMEALFVSLGHRYSKVVIPAMVELVKESAVMVSPDDNQAILQKDSVYLATGLLGFDLYDEIDFDSWLLSTLLEELKVKHSNYRIIRRRVVWLIGKWITVKMQFLNLPLVYDALLELLRNDEDIVVRLATALTISSIIGDCFFRSDSFPNYLGGFYEALFKLLKDAEYCDTKLQVLQVLNLIIETSGAEYLEPYYNGLVQYLPVVWAESENHNLLRVAVVASLSKLVKVLGHLNHSREVYDFILNVISLSTDPDNSSHIYLLEDGLDLWIAVVENIPSPSDDLLILFKNLLRILGVSTENLKACLRIIRAYAVLAPDQFLHIYGAAVCQNLNEQMSELLPEGLKHILQTLEIFLIVDRTFSVTLIKPILPFIFKAVYRADEKIEVNGLYLTIIARVLLQSQDTFVEVIRNIAPALGQSENDVLIRIVDVWLECMPSILQMSTKKVLAMALCTLLLSEQNFLYNKFSAILLAMGEAMADLESEDEDSLYEMVEEIASDGTYVAASGEEHTDRLRCFLKKDIFYQVKLPSFLKSHMEELERRLEPGMFNQLVQTVDSDTLSLVNVFDKLELAP